MFIHSKTLLVKKKINPLRLEIQTSLKLAEALSPISVELWLHAEIEKRGGEIFSQPAFSWHFGGLQFYNMCWSGEQQILTEKSMIL